jgi:hypothetical protein
MSTGSFNRFDISLGFYSSKKYSCTAWYFLDKSFASLLFKKG